jgi:hypothetical protein
MESRNLKLDPPKGFHELGTKGRNLTKKIFSFFTGPELFHKVALLS